ncbi:MAG: hypothetical protein IKQ30_05665 [Bacteroidales bacterium]|nr:hypothetical protein [Bacteroidales bacterium]
MKKSITKILSLVFLMALFVVGCTQNEAEEMPDWDITLTPVSEAYAGETSTVEVSVSKSCMIRLLVDGEELKSTTGTALSFNVSVLPTGTHSIKVSVDDSYGVYEKSFSCKIVEKPVLHQTPTMICQKVTEAYLGEHAEIAVSTEIDSKITLYIDGEEKAMSRSNTLSYESGTKTLTYDVAELAIGTHTIKIVAVNGDKKDEVSFNCVILKKQVVINYDYVDLGLPSGTLWATTNVGAENPWDYGDYFAWGETETKAYYDWDTYKYCKGTENTMTKYCNQSDYGYNGFTDNLTVLLPEDDAATVNMGSEWRMPTQAEFQELYDNCDWEWTDNYNGTGVSGQVVKSRTNSNIIFLSAAGFRYIEANNYKKIVGEYWSSSTSGSEFARELVFYSGERDIRGVTRCMGQSVRAVRVEKANNSNIHPGSVSNITIERKYYIHWANNYCSPDFKIIFNDGTQGIRIGYYNESYINEHGLILFDCSDVNSIEQLYNKWNMGSATTDEWVNEKIVLSTDGIVTYYQNGSLLASQSITAWGIEDVKSIKLDFCPYGWWTEHYQYMDDLKITIDGKVIINDQFDYFDYNVWEEPINPDGVRTEGGIMIMSQDRTDQDFHLRSKPIRLAN